MMLFKKEFAQIGVLGGGALAREVACWASRLNLKVVHFFISNLKNPSNIKVANFAPILATPSLSEVPYICGVSDPRLKTLFHSFNPSLFPALIDPQATAFDAHIGDGSVVCPGAVISINTTIGVMASINYNATVGHDCVIGDFFNIAPNASLSGTCKVGNSVTIGAGAAIKEKISICDNVTIGMGAVVVKDIVEPGIYVGCPAKKLVLRT